VIDDQCTVEWQKQICRNKNTVSLALIKNFSSLIMTIKIIFRRSLEKTVPEGTRHEIKKMLSIFFVFTALW